MTASIRFPFADLEALLGECTTRVIMPDSG